MALHVGLLYSRKQNYSSRQMCQFDGMLWDIKVGTQNEGLSLWDLVFPVLFWHPGTLLESWKVYYVRIMGIIWKYALYCRCLKRCSNNQWPLLDYIVTFSSLPRAGLLSIPNVRPETLRLRGISCDHYTCSLTSGASNTSHDKMSS